MSEANQVEISYQAEAAGQFGIAVPENAKRELRYNSESLVANINDEDSPEISSDRQFFDVIPLGSSFGGDIPTSLSHGNLDDLLPSAFFNPWTDISISGDANLAVAAGVYTDTASGFGALKVGDRVRTEGFPAAANANGWKTVTAVADDGSTVTLSPPGPNTAAGNGRSIKSSNLKNGKTRHSFSIEKKFSALDPLIQHNYIGCLVQGMAMEFRAGASVTANLTVSAQKHAQVSGPNAAVFNPMRTPAPKNLIFSPADTKGLQVGPADSLHVPDTVVLSAITMNLGNNLRSLQQLGTLDIGDIRPGRFSVEGSLEMYFSDGGLYDRFLARQETEVSWRTVEPNSDNIYYFDMPRVRVRNARIVAGGVDTDLTAQFDYRALGHRTRGYTFMMTKNAA